MKITALGIAALLAAPTWAQTTAPTSPAVGPSKPAVSPANPVPFGQLDANHDGTVSQDELRADTTFEGVKFSDIDTNHDGKVSADELATWQRREKSSRTPPKP